MRTIRKIGLVFVLSFVLPAISNAQQSNRSKRSPVFVVDRSDGTTKATVKTGATIKDLEGIPDNVNDLRMYGTREIEDYSSLARLRSIEKVRIMAAIRINNILENIDPTHVKELAVNSDRLAANGVEAILRFENLEKLKFSSGQCDLGNSSFSQLRRLHEVELNHLDDVALVLPAFSKCEALTSLTVRVGHANAEIFQRIIEISNLEELTFTLHLFGDEKARVGEFGHFEPAKPLTRLRKLYAHSGTSLDDIFLLVDKRCPIEEVNVSGRLKTARSLEPIRSWTRLRRLSLDIFGSNQSTVDFANFISSDNQIEFLKLRSKAFNDSAFCHLPRMTKLSSLNLLHTSLTAEPLDKLCDFPNLEHLKIPKVSRDHFADIKNLEHLKLLETDLMSLDENDFQCLLNGASFQLKNTNPPTEVNSIDQFRELKADTRNRN